MRMLGRWSFYPVGNCDCCRKDKKTIRNREEDKWKQDYKEEMEEE